jgi:hypothetical protein
MNLDTFTKQYLETALWAETDDNGDPLDRNHELCSFAPETLARAIADCAAFQAANAADIGERASDAGHDFWLTRNGHGTGFWDGDWPEDAGKRLTVASKRFGEIHLYVGDDGLLYFE